MRGLLVLSCAAALVFGVFARAGAPARNTEGETPFQVALREGDRAEVMSLLTETEAAYHETFTRGPDQSRSPLPRRELDRAWHVLLDLLRKNPRHASLNFAIGVLAEKRNDLARAELAFERVLQVAPGNHRAGLELARVCSRAGRDDVARRHYEYVLSQTPPDAVARNIRKQLSELGRVDKRLHVSARIDAGTIADDNVNVGPRDDVIAVFPLTVGSTLFTELSVAPESQPIEVSGAYAAATLEMLYDFGRSGGWGLTTDLNYYENWLDETEEESRLVKAAFGAKRAAKRSLAKGELYARRIWLGSDPLVDAIGLQPVYLHRFKPAGRTLYWISAVQMEQRDYDTRNAYDGLFLGIEQTVRLMVTDHASVYAGLRGAHNDADAAVFAYRGLSGVTGATFTWKRLRLYASARYTHNDYDERETLAPRDRVDKIWLLNAKARLQLFGNTGIEVKQQHTGSDSTFDLYDYERNVTMVGLWGRF